MSSPNAATAPQRPNAALAFMPEGYSTGHGKLMGRQSATEGFLRGMIHHGGVDRHIAYALAPQAMEAFEPMVRALGGRAPVSVIAPGHIAALGRIGTLLLPQPNLGEHVALRALARAERAFSITGITHTLSSRAVMAGIAGLVSQPVQDWDAVVCTSQSARAMFTTLLAAEEERLAQRLGASRFTRPRLPVIPLGIDTASFVFPPAMRAQWRAAIGAAPEDFVLLHHGRVSWHAKAHHWPMLAALGRVSARMPPGRRLHLLVAGWSSNEGQEAALRAQAAALCPNVALHRAGGLQPERRPGVWAAADAFSLLSDNIQETFGLAVIEAMAAGLPVLVSDWDGFRDTVRHGQDGFRIPSLMAAPGSAPDLAMAHGTGALDYDHFLAATTQLVAIDIAAATAALETLVFDAPARRAMAAAAQSRARGEFDWARIIPRWQDLWAELRGVREHAADPPSGPSPLPALMDHTQLFAAWPSAILQPMTMLARDPAAPAMGLAATLAVPAAIHPNPDAPMAERLARLLASVPEQGSITAQALHDAMPEAERPLAGRGMLWLLKTGFLRVVPG
jgi:glycosyltransferase involved in cell wall biosynthesis